jgi:hypothetical protein
MNHQQIPVFFIKQGSIFYKIYSSNEELLSGVYIQYSNHGLTEYFSISPLMLHAGIKIGCDYVQKTPPKKVYV